MNRRTFEPPEVAPHERTPRREVRLLALSGGGYRGLFTACILADLERGGPPIAQRFDYLAGTSIGGILAIGLACGKSGEELRQAIRSHGEKIFRPRLMNGWGLARTQYSNEGLRDAIVAILGEELANSSFASIPAALVICAVDEQSSRAKLFKTNAFGSDEATDLPVIDVALATSAAPTYFPPHRVESEGGLAGRTFVDGGLVANAPDLLLITQAWRHRSALPEDTHMLSIGTAGSARTGNVGQKSFMSRLLGSGAIGWLVRHKLVQLIMTAQEELAVHQATELGLGTYLRIDAMPENPIDLDKTGEPESGILAALAEDALRAVRANSPEALRRFHSAKTGER